MKTIPLGTTGWVAWVDDEDYEHLNKFKWHIHQSRRGVYAVRRFYTTKGSINRKQGRAFMHREIMTPPPGKFVDHVIPPETDAKVIDNTKANLRLCSSTENMRNGRKHSNCSSPFKGVCWHKVNKTFVSRIRVSGELINLGSFQVEVNAAYVYDLAAVKYFGDFAKTNFPVPGSRSWIFGEVQ